MIELPDKKKCYNLPEQVAQNLRNITFLAEQYKNIDELPDIWQTYKEEFDSDLETFGDWTTTFEGWTETLSTYLSNMSSAAVGAIAGQNIAPANVAATGNITGPSIIENMSGYSFAKNYALWTPVYCGICKNGNKLTAVMFGEFTATGDNSRQMGHFTIPTSVASKLFPYTVAGDDTILSNFKVLFVDTSDRTIKEVDFSAAKPNDHEILFVAYNLAGLTTGHDYVFRAEQTFLLSENLAS